MSSNTFQALDIRAAIASLENLHAHVATCSGRIEISCGEGKVCVLISKAELESLEQAIEILSQGSDYQKMCAEVSGVASAVGVNTASIAQALPESQIPSA